MIYKVLDFNHKDREIQSFLTTMDTKGFSQRRHEEFQAI